MKKILFLMAASAATLFNSCSKDRETINNSITDPTDGSVISLSFVEESSSKTTRAFFDSDADAEKWEQELKTVTIFAFDDNDELIVRRDFSDSEIEVKKSVFALPGTSVGDEVSIVVVANDYIPMDTVTLTSLKAIINSKLNEYNGLFSEVSESGKREDGFIMTSYNDVTIIDGATTIDATLERTVAKVAIEMTLAEDFSDRYSGDMLITSIEVSNTPSTTTLHKSFEFDSAPLKDYTHYQLSNISSDKFQNLFYIYESDTPTSDSEKVQLTVEATYDMDGDFTTTSDQTPLTYTIPLEDNNISKVERNSYYRISGTISGLSGSNAEISITVSNWATLTNKEVDLGN